jgi:hypothetical protein
MFKYKTIEEIPYEDMTDELKERLDGDFELLTEDNIKNLKEGMKVHYVPLDFNTKLKYGFFYNLYDGNIMGLMVKKRRKCIYMDDNIIFVRFEKKSKMRIMMESLLKNDFKIVLKDEIPMDDKPLTDDKPLMDDKPLTEENPIKKDNPEHQN